MANSLVPAEPAALSSFLQRLHQRGHGRMVVLHTGRRTYVGRLLKVDAASVRLDAESDEFEQSCRLEVDPGRIEAFEILSG
jgi:hypothetical protein